MFVKLFCVIFVGLCCYMYVEVFVCFFWFGEILDDYG